MRSNYLSILFFKKTLSHFRLLLVLFTVSMPLLNGMKIVELYLAVNQHVKTFMFSNPFLSTAKVLIHALKLFVRMRWIVNCKLQSENQNLEIHKNFNKISLVLRVECESFIKYSRVLFTGRVKRTLGYLSFIE